MYEETTNIIINYNKIRSPSSKPRVTVESPNNKPTKSDLLEHKTINSLITNTETVNVLTSASVMKSDARHNSTEQLILADLVCPY
jgi:hypothetical protein